MERVGRRTEGWPNRGGGRVLIGSSVCKNIGSIKNETRDRRSPKVSEGQREAHTHTRIKYFARSASRRRQQSGCKLRRPDRGSRSRETFARDAMVDGIELHPERTSNAYRPDRFLGLALPVERFLGENAYAPLNFHATIVEIREYRAFSLSSERVGS
ncbi:PREDICTED: uncharacterized protein LOC108554810 [Eufriesea mexicana]|uniref:uncharacterized protein LOC108554810 n=1 Tax=Eufriesea mexicana TaxID=516756 RepID=UPI00083BE78B|nr:PREDICTED: uncharacterized protein LOC108554810 [Eufriesea mexicana]